MSHAAGVTVDRVRFSIGSFTIESFSLQVKPGEYFVLSGPNGSGKTLLLKLICGILRPLAGTITVEGRDVTDTPPWERGIGYVPQDGLLFPHLDVRENVAFPLHSRGMHKDERARRATELLAMLGVEHLAGRRVRGLSGGERQKVALGRALAAEPSVLLLDEPVSAIDEAARDGVCRDLKALQRRLGITTIHVSHNSAETDLVADRVGRVQNGCIIG